jgi:uncharacterized protein YjiS (DUF1127 family)
MYNLPDPNKFKLSKIAQRLRVIFFQAQKILLTWIERSRNRKELAKLDDQLLADIAITRKQVEEEISKPFWR